MLGDTLNSANDSNEQVINTYTEVMNKVMPQDLYDAVDGNVKVRLSQGSLIFEIGNPGDPYYVRELTYDAYGSGDSTANHFAKIKKAIKTARDLVIKDRTGQTGNTGQSGWEAWQQEQANQGIAPPYSFADYLASR